MKATHENLWTEVAVRLAAMFPREATRERDLLYAMGALADAAEASGVTAGGKRRGKLRPIMGVPPGTSL